MKNKKFAIVLLAMAAFLFLPLVASADETWLFWGNQAPFNDPFPPGTSPAISVGAVGELLNVTNGNGFTVQLQALDNGNTGALGQLTDRNLGPGTDEQGAGVGFGPYSESISNTFEVNGQEAIGITFPSQADIPGFASEHLFFNSLTAQPGIPEIAHIWADAPFSGTSLGTIVHQANVAFEDFSIPQSAWGHPIFVTADAADFLLYGASVDTAVPEPSTLLLLGSGLIGLAGYARKRIRK